MKYKLHVLLFLLAIISTCIVSWFAAINYSNDKIMITEVRSDYGNILYDADGSCHGFVELYNCSDKSIDLSGWYISDIKNNFFKYRIDNCIVGPREYAVFWSNELADVIEIMDSGNFMDFSIDNGESIILTNSNGDTIDKVMIPELSKGESYCRTISHNIWYKTKPTPGALNSTDVSSIKISSPSFSKKSGFYEDGVKIKISAAPGCKIYYTVDGSEPTAASMLYTEALTLYDNSSNENIWSAIDNITVVGNHIPETDITISNITPDEPVPKINVIKAVSVDKNGNMSDVASASYLVGYKNKYGFDNTSYGYDNSMIMSITTDEDNLFGDKFGIYTTGDIYKKYKSEEDVPSYTSYTNYSVSGKGWRRPAKIELFNENQQLVESQDIAISIHGGWSVAYNQKSFNLYAQPDKYGKEVLLKSLFTGKQRSLMLRTGGFRDTFSTKVRDVLNQTMMQNTNVLATDYYPCHVFINGEYWGLYNLQERIDASLVSGHYNINPENAIVLKNFAVVAGNPGEEHLFSDVIDFAEQNDLSLEHNYTRICEMIDIESCIDYYIFQTYVANCDSIANNYSVWRSRNIVDDKYADGKWRWILYDTDDSADMVKGFTQSYTDSFSSGHWAKAPMQDELFTALIENEDFKIRFADRFIQLAQSNFSYDNVISILSELEKQYVPATTVSHKRFINSNYSEIDYYQQLQIIKNFYAERYMYIYKYMVANLGLEVYGY